MNNSLLTSTELGNHELNGGFLKGKKSKKEKRKNVLWMDLKNHQSKTLVLTRVNIFKDEDDVIVVIVIIVISVTQLGTRKVKCFAGEDKINPVPKHEHSGFVMTRKNNPALCKGTLNVLSLLFELDVKRIVAHSWYIITLDVNLILIFG